MYYEFLHYEIDVYLKKDEEIRIAHLQMLALPRIGEAIRIMDNRNDTWWRVVDVCHITNQLRGHVSREAYIIVRDKEGYEDQPYRITD